MERTEKRSASTDVCVRLLMNIFDFDNEQNILNYLLRYTEQVLLSNGNSFEKKILRYIKDIDSFTSNNGHGDLPPDYYSDRYSVMFDVLRINDTEVNKKYNPIKIEERKMRKQVLKSGMLDTPNIITVFASDDVNEHSFDKYIKQAKRTIKNHIDKIPLWIKEHPAIKNKGLLVFDETEFCFEGFVKYVGNGEFAYCYKSPLVIHEAWNDKMFVQPIYESNLDFVIWFCPYKPYGNIPMKHNIKFPSIVIADTRFQRTNYKEYDYNSLVM